MTTRRPTRADVAQLAGTSVAVVSYVLNDGPRGVSTELRDRVREAMTSLDYVPNALARSLGGTRTRTVGMIVPNIANAYFAELALAVENTAAEHGQLLFLGNSNEDRDRELAYVQSFVERRVDGIVVIGVAQSTSIAAAQRSNVPVVVVDRDLRRPDLPTVSIDHRSAARLATEHLLSHGHRRIACVAGPLQQPVAEERLRGHHEALAAAGIDPDEIPVLRTPFSALGGRSIARHLATATAMGVSAVFVSTDEQARGLIAGIGQLGVDVPEDLALVSIDGTREGAEGNPGLTSVRQPYQAIAEAAVAALATSDESPTRHVTVPTELQIRRSCGCTPSEEH